MFKKWFKKGLCVSLILALLVTFNATGTLANNDCGCDNKGAPEVQAPAGTQYSSQDFEKMNADIKKNKYTFQIGRNSVTQYSINQLCGLKAPEKIEQAPISGSIQAVRALPASYDPRASLTPVRNQGSCGSCWAFGTAGVFECTLAIKAGIKTDLSEQYLLSCNTKGYSCSGGWWVHEMHQNYGAVPESAFPYVGSKVACKSGLTHTYKISGWGYVGASMSVPSVEAIKTAIYNYGAVAAAVYVDSYFQSYRGGIFNRSVNGTPNHAILLVGWDESKKAFLLRNSWGSGWGEGGYMWIGYGVSKVGYNATYVVYNGGSNPTIAPTPVVKPTPTPNNNTPIPTGTWKAGTYYSVGSTVTYGGRTYACVIAHTAQVGWEPPNAPSLWSLR